MKYNNAVAQGSAVLNASLMLGTVVSLGGVIWAQYKDRQHRSDYPGFATKHIKSPTSNRLQVLVAETTAESDSWYVLVPGLSSSASTMVGIGSILAGAGHNVVLFNRAGYGGSVRLSEEPFHFNEYITDLREVMRFLNIDSESSLVHLVGHSLGGYLQYRFAQAHPELVSKVTYLDPMHPNELINSSAQRIGARGVDLALNTITPFMWLGAALLYEREILGYAKNYPFKDRIHADLASASVWKAAREEWKLIYPLMLDGTSISPLDRHIETQVIAAGKTILDDPSQVDLYREYSSVLRELSGVDHKNMLTDHESQHEIARLLETNGVQFNGSSN